MLYSVKFTPLFENTKFEILQFFPSCVCDGVCLQKQTSDSDQNSHLQKISKQGPTLVLFKPLFLKHHIAVFAFRLSLQNLSKQTTPPNPLGGPGEDIMFACLQPPHIHTCIIQLSDIKEQKSLWIVLISHPLMVKDPALTDCNIRTIVSPPY